MSTTVATLQTVFTADTSNFDDGARRVNDSLASTETSFGQRLTNMGHSITGLGLSLTALAAPVAAGLGFAVNSAIQFESAFTGVAKTVDATDSELASLRQTIRDMATSSDNPLAGLENAHVTLATIMEMGGQLGIAVQDMDAFTQVVGELAISTNLSAEEAATMFAQFTNITGMDFSSFRDLGDTLVDLGNKGASTEKDIMSMSLRIAAAGSSAGLSEPQIMGYASAMASLGLEAEMAGSGFSQFINTLSIAVAQGGTELTTFASVAGTSATDFAELWRTNPNQAILEFLTGLGSMDRAAQLESLDTLGLSGIRLTDVMGRLSSNVEMVSETVGIGERQFSTFSDILANQLGGGALPLTSQALIAASAEFQTLNPLAEEAGKRFETTESQINLAKNQINDAMISIGDGLTPALRDLLTAVAPVIANFGQWASENPGTVQTVAVVTAGVLALGLGLTVLGTIVSGVGMLVTAFGAILGVLTTGLGMVSGAVGVVIAILGAPLAAVIAAGIALGAGLYAAWNSNFLGIRDFVSDAINTISGVLKSLEPTLNSIKGVFESVFSAIGGAVQGALDIINGIGDAIDDAISGIGNLLDSSGGASNTIAHAMDGWVNPRTGETMQGNAEGTSWTGGMGRNQIAGWVHGQEAVVPAEGMQVIPSPRGLMLEGAVRGGGGGNGGNGIYINTVVVQANDMQQLYDSLQRVASQRA